MHDGVNVTRDLVQSVDGIDGQAMTEPPNEPAQRHTTPVPGTDRVGTRPVPGTGEHQPVYVRQSAYALKPVVMGTPYCARCNIGWPCPSATAAAGQD